MIAGGVLVPVSEFGGVKPEAGDECVLMGNTENPLRQNLISIAATEDGQPRIDILDGVKAKNFNGCLRCRLGKLDGIRSSAFPADKQPKGNGLYADNVWLKGTFVLMTGEDILTRFEITEGKIHSAVESLRKEIREEQSYLDNSSFADGMDKWKTGSKATLFTLGGRWIWANGGPYGTKPDGHAEIRTDGKVALCLYPEQLYHAETGGLPAGTGVPADEQPGANGCPAWCICRSATGLSRPEG